MYIYIYILGLYRVIIIESQPKVFKGNLLIYHVITNGETPKVLHFIFGILYHTGSQQ